MMSKKTKPTTFDSFSYACASIDMPTDLWTGSIINMLCEVLSIGVMSGVMISVDAGLFDDVKIIVMSVVIVVLEFLVSVLLSDDLLGDTVVSMFIDSFSDSLTAPNNGVNMLFDVNVKVLTAVLFAMRVTLEA